MTRIEDLGEACDDAVKRMREIVKGENVREDPRNTEQERRASIELIHAYFDYSGSRPR